MDTCSLLIGRKNALLRNLPGESKGAYGNLPSVCDVNNVLCNTATAFCMLTKNILKFNS